VEAGLAVGGEGLEAELATAQELLGEHRALVARADLIERALEAGEVAHPKRGLGAHAGGRLHHDGEAHLVDELLRVGPAPHQAMARRGQARSPERVLHAGLVAEQIGGLGQRAGNAEVLARLGELHLERLEDPQDAADLSVLLLERADGVDELLGGEPVLDLDHVVEDPPVLTLGELLKHAEELHALELRRGAGEAHGGLEREGGDEDDVAHGPRWSPRAEKRSTRMAQPSKR
jgi:hypothetical protein